MTKPTLAEFLAGIRKKLEDEKNDHWSSHSPAYVKVLLAMLAKAREGLAFIESKAVDRPEDWDFPGMATELLGDLQELVPEGGA